MKTKINIRDFVKSTLETTASARDCDYRLYMDVLFKYNCDAISALTLIRFMKNGHIPSFESVSRARRQLQQHFPELRGELWSKRQNEIQDNRKKELGYDVVQLIKY